MGIWTRLDDECAERDERRFDTCPVCHEKKMLIFFLGSYKGQPAAGWMCNDCYVEIRDKRSERGEDNDPNSNRC